MAGGSAGTRIRVSPWRRPEAIISFAQNDTKTSLRILGSLKSYSSYTKTEDKALVTHSQLLIEDLK